MVVRRPELSPLVATFDNLLREVVHTAAKVEALKPEKVILYSTQTCPYCVMEKKWLDEKEIDHEVVYVDQSREAAEEMVKKTGQMGVPVTEITYTDADSEFIIGFDKNRLSQSLGLH
ncbi:glutaredoxin family protein [candidate division WWE3 bacterium]|nr:glutaredoxin family protein [candidate division WWE3 bacterium]